MIAIGDPTVMESGQLEADIADRQTERDRHYYSKEKNEKREQSQEEREKEALRFLLRYKWV